MFITFKIIKLFNHHNRGQFIVARQLNFKEPLVINEGSLLEGISVYHCLEMYPIGKDSSEPEFDMYVFRPTALKGYPKGFFQEGQVVELILKEKVTTMALETFENGIKALVPKLIELARSMVWNDLSENYKFIFTEIEDNNENFHQQRRTNKWINDKKTPVPLAELMPALKKLYYDFHDVNLEVYKATKNSTTIDFRYYPKSSLDMEYHKMVLNNPSMLHVKVALPPWLTDKNKKFDINWQHKEWLVKWRMFFRK